MNVRRPAISLLAGVVLLMLLPGVATAAFPGADGSIAYRQQAGAGESPDIWKIEPDGSGRVQLTSTPEGEYAPAYSADGERIAYIRYPDTDPTYGEVWVMNADGSGQTKLAGGVAGDDLTEPAFSPDGKLIAYSRYDSAISDNQVWVMNADGSQQHALTARVGVSYAGAPAFSPDGTRIAITYQDNGGSSYERIGVMNADGSGLANLSPELSLHASAPDWSPDGSRIIFTLGTDIQTMSSTGVLQQQLTEVAGPPFDGNPVFSPQGGRFVFDRGFLTPNIRIGDSSAELGPTSDLVTDPRSEDPSWQPLNPPSCDIGKPKPKRSGKRITVIVTCLNENATVTIEGSGKAPKTRGPQGGHGRKASKFTIPPVTAEVPALGSADVVVKVPKRAARSIKRAMASGKRPKAKLIATFTDGLGQAMTDSAKVKYEFKRK